MTTEAFLLSTIKDAVQVPPNSCVGKRANLSPDKMTLSEAPGSEQVGSGERTTCCARFEVQSAPIRTVYSHKNPNYTWIAAQLKEKLNNIWILL